MSDTIPEDIPQKQCYRCGKYFPATRQFFFANKKAKDGLLTRCKGCSKQRQPRYQTREGYRRCPHCKTEFPLTAEYFHVDKSQPHGLDYRCKQCILAFRAKQYATAKQKVRKGIPDELTCKKCGSVKPTTEEYFHKDPVKRYGFVEVCKQCRSDQIKIYRREHLEKMREQWKRNYPKHKEKRRTYYLAHKVEWRNRARQRYQANIEVYRERRRRYAHSERGQVILQACSRARKARKRGAEGKFTGKDIQRQFRAQHGKCYWCQKQLANYHIDHIVPVSRGGTNWPDNIVISCPSCNHKKHNKLPHEWPEGGRLL